MITRNSILRAVCYLFLIVAAGCASSGDALTDSDNVFGHRVEGESDDGRSTIVIQPPDEDRTYNYYPATFQSIHVRAEPMTAERTPEGVAVEILVKGAFPDACTELHDVVQERAGNVIRVTLRMRRPTAAVCASVLRPYRFYLELEGRYGAGPYSLLLNDESNPFVVRAPAGG